MADSDRLNLAEYFLDHNVPSRAGKVAVHYGDAAITYGEIHAGANRVAHALRRLGIRMEDRVLLVLPDRPEFVTSLFGILKAGGVLAMANPLVTTEDVLYYLNYTRAPVAVLAEPVARAVAERRRELPHLREALVVGGGAEAGPFLPFEKTIAAEKADFPNAPTHRDDPAVWLFTSGTSGKPKAAMHLQRDFVFNTENYAKKVLRIAESDRTLSVPKLFFGYATGTNLWFPFAVGASTVLFEEHPTPAILFALARRHSPTVLTAVPTMIAKMVQDEGARKEDLASLRVCLSAGEALPPELYRRFTERFGVEILDGIGSAEMFHIYISNRIGEVRPGTLGTLVPGYEARLRELWRHSAVSACYGREVAQLLRRDMESAFLCGLLHDVGMPIVMQLVCDLERERAFPPVTAPVMEAAMAEFHRELGARIADKWQLGPWIAAAILHHHDPSRASALKDEVQVTALADLLAYWCVDDGKDESDFPSVHPQLPTGLLREGDLLILLGKRGRVLALAEGFL